MATYYVSNGGSDAANGLSPQSAWRTLSKVSGFTFASGDTVLFKRGDRWDEQITAISATNMTLGAYGDAAVFDGDGYCTNAPTFNGGAFVTGWSPYAGGQPDAFLSDDFTGVAGNNITTSTAEIGTGSWVSQLGLGTMIFSTANTARRNNTSTQAMYTFTAIMPRAAHRVTGNVKVVSQDATNDITRIFSHVNPSNQGYDRSVWAQLQYNTGTGWLFRLGYNDTTATVATSDSVAITVGNTYAVAIEVERTSTATIARGYLDGVLINSFDWGSTLTGAFYESIGQVGFLLGSSTTAVGSDTTGMQMESFQCEPIGAGGTPTNTYQATLASDPKIVNLRGKFAPDGAGVNLLQDGEKLYQGGVLYVRSDQGIPSNTSVIGGSLQVGLACGTRSNMTVSGLAFENFKQSAILWSGSASNNIVRDCYAQVSGGDTNATGVIGMLGTATNGLIERCVIRHTVLDGIWFDTPTNPIVQDCFIGPFYHPVGDAIQVGSGAVGTTVSGTYRRNTIMLTGGTSPKGGIILFGNGHLVADNYFEGGSNFGVSCPGDNFIVRGNAFVRVGPGGGFRLTDNSATAHSNHEVYYNVFVDCSVAIFAGFLTGTANLTNQNYHHNVFVNSASSAMQTLFSGYGVGQVFLNTPIGGQFQDNFLWYSRSASDSKRQYKVATLHSSGWTERRNTVGPKTAVNLDYLGSPVSTLPTSTIHRDAFVSEDVPDDMLVALSRCHPKGITAALRALGM